MGNHLTHTMSHPPSRKSRDSSIQRTNSIQSCSSSSLNSETDSEEDDSILTVGEGRSPTFTKKERPAMLKLMESPETPELAAPQQNNHFKGFLWMNLGGSKDDVRDS